MFVCYVFYEIEGTGKVVCVGNSKGEGERESVSLKWAALKVRDPVSVVRDIWSRLNLHLDYLQLRRHSDCFMRIN